MSKEIYYEKFLSKGIYTNATHTKGITFSDYKKLNEREREQSFESYSKSIEQCRQSALKERAKEDVEISQYKLKHYMQSNGYPLNETKKVDDLSTEQIKTMNPKNEKVKAELSFATGAILEGMFGVFGEEQYKSLEKYQNQLHVIETEKGSFIGHIGSQGHCESLSEFMDKNEAETKLNEFKELQKEKHRNEEHEIEQERTRTREESFNE